MSYILVSSSVSGAMAATWLTIWVMLEVNTMAMCYLMMKDTNKNKKKSANTMKYFLVQVLASSFIIALASYSKNNTQTELIMVLMLTMKMGAWPIHTWFMSLVSKLDMKKMSFFTIVTWQKVLPALMVSNMSLMLHSKMTLVGLCMLSVLSPILMMKSNMSNKNVMALSSLNSNGWLILAALLSTKILLIFIAIYTMVLKSSLSEMSMMMSTKKKDSSSSTSMMMMLANLGGLPPLSMFWAKLMITVAAMQTMVNKKALMVMLMMSCALMFLYSSMVLPYVMKQMKKSMNSMNMKKTNKKDYLWVASYSTLSMVMLLMMV